MQFFDRVQQTTATTGTGTYTLSATAADGFVAISSRYSDGAEVPYCCTDDTDFEVGIGTYAATGNTLSRDTILASSNSGAAVSWGSGDKKMFVTLPAASINRMPFGTPMFFFDGTMVAGVPVERIGAYEYTVGSYGLTAETVTGGVLDGRPAIVSASQAGSCVVFQGSEELRITGEITIAGWVNLSQTSIGTLFNCESAGESLITNTMYSLRLASGKFYSFVEYSAGSNSQSQDSQDISGCAGDWCFLVYSRSSDGRTIGLSIYNDTDNSWINNELLLPQAAAKATSGNIQTFVLFSLDAETNPGPGMSCAGLAMWNRYMHKAERQSLKDVFFYLA